MSDKINNTQFCPVCGRDIGGERDEIEHGNKENGS